MARKPTAADKLKAQLEQAQQPQPITDPTPTHIDDVVPVTTDKNSKAPKPKKPKKQLISCYISSESYALLNELAKFRTKYKENTGYSELVDEAVKQYIEAKMPEVEIWREYESKLPPIPDIPE